MKSRTVLAGFAALCLSAAAFAQQAAQAPAPTPEFSANAFRAHVTFLADDLLEGRDTGSRGHEIAARYVATQFEALGLRPGNGDSWYQRVEFVRVANDAGTTLTIGGHTYTQGREIAFRAGAETAPVALEAPLVFVGYGLDVPSHGFDDYRGLDVRGKIVVVLSGTPAGIPSDVAAHFSGDKRRMAAARGAVGMITVRTRADSAAMPFARMARFADRPLTTWLEPDGTAYSDGAGLQFSGSVDDAVANAMFVGARRSFDQVLEDASRIGARPAGFALRPQARVARTPGAVTRFSSPNVLAVLPGTDPSVAGEYVLLMAHLVLQNLDDCNSCRDGCNRNKS